MDFEINDWLWVLVLLAGVIILVSRVYFLIFPEGQVF